MSKTEKVLLILFLITMFSDPSGNVGEGIRLVLGSIFGVLFYTLPLSSGSEGKK